MVKTVAPAWARQIAKNSAVVLPAVKQVVMASAVNAVGLPEVAPKQALIAAASVGVAV